MNDKIEEIKDIIRDISYVTKKEDIVDLIEWIVNYTNTKSDVLEKIDVI